MLSLFENTSSTLFTAVLLYLFMAVSGVSGFCLFGAMVVIYELIRVCRATDQSKA